MEKEKIIKILEELLNTFRGTYLHYNKEKLFAKKHGFEIEAMALEYKEEAYKACEIDLSLLINELKGSCEKIKHGEEIEIPYGAKDSEFLEGVYYIPDGFHAEIDDNKVVIKKGKENSAWTEEDDKMFNLLHYCINEESVSEGLRSLAIQYHIDDLTPTVRKIEDWVHNFKKRLSS